MASRSGTQKPSCSDTETNTSAVARVARDQGLREALVTAGRERLATFAPEVVSSRLLDVLQAHGVAGSA